MIAIYCRISGRKEDGKDTSIQTQKEKGIKFANSLGLKYRIFVDEGISGAKDEIEERPQFSEMLKAIANKEFTIVWCFDQSRLERNPRIWLSFQYLMKKTSCKFYPAGVYMNIEDPLTKLVSGVVSLTNQMFASVTGQKVKLAFNARALQGKTHGMVAYGYETDEKGFYAINGNEAKIVKGIYESSFAGNGCYTIAKMLNKEGVPTKYNNLSGTLKRKDKYTHSVRTFNKEDVIWRGNVIHDMIVNPIYKGCRKWNDEIIRIPAIIEEELWEKVNKNLQVNKKHAGKRDEYQYLLNGLIYCANCGSEYRGKINKAAKDSVYRCKGKFSLTSKCSVNKGINIAKIETFIITHLFLNKELEQHLLALPPNPEEPNQLKKNLEKVQSQISGVERRISNLRNALMDKELSDDKDLIQEYKLAKSKRVSLSAEADLLQNQIFESENEFSKKRLKNSIGEYKLTSNFDTTKKLIHSLIERINIKYIRKEKGGYFIIEIKYRGFVENSIFMTDLKAMEWTWLNHYRSGAITKNDLKDDTEAMKYLMNKQGVNLTLNNFTGFETAEVGLGNINLKSDELISFN
jgi:DNA invertase Pin-like site-specific DNA recombinase